MCLDDNSLSIRLSHIGRATLSYRTSHFDWDDRLWSYFIYPAYAAEGIIEV
jgi:hypothetical protein